jgi:hypothetical protein
VKKTNLFDEKSGVQTVALFVAAACLALKNGKIQLVEQLLLGIDALDDHCLHADVYRWAIMSDRSLVDASKMAEVLLKRFPTHPIAKGIVLASRYRSGQANYKELLADVLTSDQCELALAMTGLDTDLAFQGEIRKFRLALSSAPKSSNEPVARRSFKFV